MLSRTGLLALASSFMLTLGVSAAPEAVLVKNINTTAKAVGTTPEQITPAGKPVFFTAHQPQYGQELWMSDEVAGTRLVKDIYPGTGSSSIGPITAVGTKVFFNAKDDVHGQELWVSDGTSAGTRMVADLVSGPGGGLQGSTTLLALGKGVVFAATSDWTPWGLWYSDGTESGTRFLKALPQDSASLPYLTSATLGTSLYFHFGGDGENYRLWKTDGTVSGTVEIRNVPPGPYLERILGSAGKNLYLLLWEEETGGELWKLDAKATAPVLIKDIEPGMSDSSLSTFVAVKDKAYFQAYTAENGWEIWMSDGTAAGTRLAHADVNNPGANYHEMVLLGQNLITSNATEVAAHNLKTGATTRLFDAGEHAALDLTVVGTKLFFVARTGAQQFLHVSDGTAAGTTALAPQTDLVDDQNPLRAAGSQVYFTGAQGGSSDPVLWKSDGSVTGTRALQNLQQGDKDSFPKDLCSTASGFVYFGAADSSRGDEIWRSDGTPAGTTMVKDIRPGILGSFPMQFIEMNGIVYFTAETPEEGRELWRTDGTAAGTTLVKDLHPGNGGSDPHKMTVFGGRLYFFTAPPTGGKYKLWSTDGTADGTVLISELYQAVGGRDPDPLVEMNGRLYFVRYSATNSPVLLSTDGTPGAVLETARSVDSLKTISNLTVGPAPGEPGGQALYFIGTDSSTDQKSIGRVPGSGPGLITDVSPLFADVLSLDRSGGSLMFVVRQAEPAGYQIWRTTGAPEGAGPVQTGPDFVQSLAVVGDDFYFLHVIENSRSSLRRLHLPTGTTTSVMDEIFWPEKEVVIGDTLYFRGWDGAVSGMWQTRGTPESTQKLQGIHKNVIYQDKPQQAGNRLLIPAVGPGIGQELFAVQIGGQLEIIHISGQQDEIRVPVKTDGTGTVDLGSQYVSYLRGSTLRLRNSGLQPLLNVVVPAGSGPFTVEDLVIPRLEAGEEVVVQVSFTPQAVGEAQASLTFTGTSELSGGAFTIPVTLRGTGLADRGRPVITRMPDHRIVRVGEPLMYQADCQSALPLTKQVWQRSGKAVASTSILNIPSAQIQDAGLYTFSATNAAGTTKSNATILVVVGPIQETLAVPEDGLLTLKATVAAPSGSDVTYQWLRGGIPLSDFNRVRGSRSATLTVSGMSETDTGPYECAVALTTNGQTTLINPAPGVTVVSMLKKPVFAPSQTPGSFLAEEVSYQIIVQDFTSLKVKGLPPGLKMNSGGLVTGRATKAGVYPLTLTATNANGPRVHTLPWTVVPALPAGVYDGLISQDSGRATETQLGSRLMMIATSTGTLSCRFVYEGRVLSFAGIPAFKGLREDTTPATVLSEFNLIQGGTQPTLTLRFESGPQGILLLLKNGETLLGSGSIYRTRFYATDTPATDLVGNSTWHSQPEVISEDTPQGHGYAVAATTQDGMVYFQGRLADGTAVLGSSPLLKNPMDPNRLFFCFRHYLYPVGSSYAGTYGGEVDLQPDGENRYRFSGALDWKKAALPATSKERNYKDGIPLHSVFLFGSTYVPPASGKLVWNLTAGTGNGSFATAPAGGNIAQGILDIGAANKVTLPPVTGEMPLKTLTFDVKQGIFKGTLLFLGETAKLNRTVTFEGALDSLDREGNGAFLLPDLPTDGTTLTTSPLRSGAIQIRAEAGE